MEVSPASYINHTLIFSFSVSDREMLRMWKDLSEKYKIDYADDYSHEYIEVYKCNLTNMHICICIYAYILCYCREILEKF